jgi:hypothetical protein
MESGEADKVLYNAYPVARREAAILGVDFILLQTFERPDPRLS